MVYIASLQRGDIRKGVLNKILGSQRDKDVFAGCKDL